MGVEHHVKLKCKYRRSMKPNYTSFITVCGLPGPPVELRHRLLRPSHACRCGDLISATYVKDQSGICYLKWFELVLSNITAMCLWTSSKNYGWSLMGLGPFTLMYRNLKDMNADAWFPMYWEPQVFSCGTFDCLNLFSFALICSNHHISYQVL